MKNDETKQAPVGATLDTREMEARYGRALAWLKGHGSTSLVKNDRLLPRWISGSPCFWYERATNSGTEFRLVDAVAATNTAAFDHEVFASALSEAANQPVDKDNLPIGEVTFTLSSPSTGDASADMAAPVSAKEIRFTAFGERFLYQVDRVLCTEDKVLRVQLDEALSPDSKHIVFRRDHNLWVRSVDSGEERALTEDGEKDFAYGADSSGWGPAMPREVPALWSPDSKRILTVKRDKRQVLTLPIVNHVPQDGSVRPTLEEVKVAYPGDEHVEEAYLLSIDIETGTLSWADHGPLTPTKNEHHGFYGKLVWWAADSRRAYFIDDGRGARVVRLMEFDTDRGQTRLLMEETSETYINITTDNGGSPKHRFLPKTQELIWWSERSDWGHLYLIDLATGAVKNAITSGEWRVRDVLQIDEERRELLIQTAGRIAGRNPYYRDICRVHMDTGEVTTVLSSDEDLIVHYPEAGFFTRPGKIDGVSPCCQYLVLTRSRIDQAPVSLLIDRNGTEILTLEETDMSALPEDWCPPKPVELLAADGKTDLYGALFYPSGFTTDKQYPVINMINGGPWLPAVPKASFNSALVYADMFYFYCSAMAELGFIVLVLDSRGTPLRSKSFQDESYGWIPSAGNTGDHAGAIEQLTERYPYMDADRVGIFTVTGYRSALQNFLERQDLYKVCVQMNLMDNRLIGGTIEGEKYEGVDGPTADKLYPEQLVDNLRGKLLLITSLYSSNSAAYPAAGILRVVDALQKANKDFDQVIVGTGGRGRTVSAYQYRRAFDYLVTHLLGAEPPKEFSFDVLEM
ncbi:DPP IV N-terminal domain-containing protein [Kordiimonas sp.]|uniref:S9 family peptidase n=1 Tax=Kordiimonas sp. TaxID=1970157 RepID=UPI003A924A07